MFTNLLKTFFIFLKRKILGFKSRKRLFFLLGIFLTLLLIFIIWVYNKDFSQEKMTWGVTFSKFQAEKLGLDWQETYLAILDELQVKHLRIPVYWPDIEPEKGNFNFKDYNWLINQAQEVGAKIILVTGRRLPRWPECHQPKWTVGLTEEEIQQRILTMIAQVVNHYKNYSAIKAWQIENEPLLRLFGKCPKPDKDFLKQEIALVKSLDSRPIVITDSGELSGWFRTGKIADILGTTMYRVVGNRYLGYLHHPLPPAYYHYKADFIMALYDLPKVIISELQVEPWARDREVSELTLEEQFRSMDLEQVNKNLDFAQRTGLEEAYLWGVEWWYWLKVKHKINDFWALGKTLW